MTDGDVGMLIAIASAWFAIIMLALWIHDVDNKLEAYDAEKKKAK